MTVFSLALKIILVIALPFFVAVRGSLIAWRYGGLPAWLALLCGAALAAVVVTGLGRLGFGQSHRAAACSG